MTVTKVLGNQTGIQHQGVQDKSEADPRDALLNVVFTGNFKRGRMDRPFKVTPHDYRAKLGHDPENQAYSAIEDALTDGAPFVWVQRVAVGSSGSHKIEISPDLQYEAPEREQLIWWTLEIDNEFVTGNINDDSEGEYLEEYLKSNSSTLGITGEYTDSPSKITLTNLTNNRKFVRLIPSIPYKSEMSFSGNSTVSIGSDGTISFWLEANKNAVEPEPEPEPEPEVCNCEQDWVLIPSITPSTTLGYYDEFVVETPEVVSSNTSYKAGTPVIDLLTAQTKYPNFVNKLSIVRCDESGTLIRNISGACLKIAIYARAELGNGYKEIVSYLKETSLCPYDSSEVLPEPEPVLGQPFTFISSGGEARVSASSSEGPNKMTIDWGDGVLVNYKDHGAGFVIKTGIAELSTVKVYFHGPQTHATLYKYVAVTDWGDTPCNSFQLKDILLPEYTERRVPDYLPKYVTSLDYMFSVTDFNEDVSMWDVSHVTSMQSTFAETPINHPFDGWDVSNVTTFSRMFYLCRSFNQPLNSWDVSSAKSMNSMFYAGRLFNQPLNNWDVSNVEDMTSMFGDECAFNQDISKWCVSKITSAPDGFTDWMRGKLIEEYKPVWGTCPIDPNKPKEYLEFTSTGGIINTVGLVAGDTITGDNDFHKDATDSSTFFELPAGRYRLTLSASTMSSRPMDLSISGAISEVHNFPTTPRPNHIFFHDELSVGAKITKVPDYLPPNITNLSGMFLNNSLLVGDELSIWDVSHVTDMSSLFEGTKLFNADIGGWDTSKVINMKKMFSKSQVFNQPISGWDVSHVTDMGAMFNNAAVFDQPLVNWCVSGIASMPSAFSSGSPLGNEKLPVWGTCPSGV